MHSSEQPRGCRLSEADGSCERNPSPCLLHHGSGGSRANGFAKTCPTEAVTGSLQGDRGSRIEGRRGSDEQLGELSAEAARAARRRSGHLDVVAAGCQRRCRRRLGLVLRDGERRGGEGSEREGDKGVSARSPVGRERGERRATHICRRRLHERLELGIEVLVRLGRALLAPATARRPLAAAPSPTAAPAAAPTTLALAALTAARTVSRCAARAALGARCAIGTATGTTSRGGVLGAASSRPGRGSESAMRSR